MIGSTRYSRLSAKQDNLRFCLRYFELSVIFFGKGLSQAERKYKEFLLFGMEALALLVAILAFLALLAKEIKPDPPSAGDQFVKGLKAVIEEVKGNSKPPEKNDQISPLTVMAIAVLFGFLLMYIR